MKRIILGLLLFISLLSSCVSYKEIEYRSIEGVGIEKWDGDNVHIAINVKVFNPNSYAIKVKDADLKAAFNGSDLGDVKLINTLKLDANSETVQKVICQISGKKIISLVPMAFLTGKSKLTLKGDLKAKVFIFSKKFPVDITENIDMSEIKTGF